MILPVPGIDEMPMPKDPDSDLVSVHLILSPSGTDSVEDLGAAGGPDCCNCGRGLFFLFFADLDRLRGISSVVVGTVEAELSLDKV